MEEVMDAETGLVQMIYSDAECLVFPFYIPGYGQIVNHGAWQTFLLDFQFRCEALARVTRHCQMQELSAEIDQEQMLA